MSIPLFDVELGAFARQVGACPTKQIVLVLDRAGWHTSVRLRVPEHVHLLFLPPLYRTTSQDVREREVDDTEGVLGKGSAALAVRPLRIDGPSQCLVSWMLPTIEGCAASTGVSGHDHPRPRVVLVGSSRREATVWYVGIDWADDHHDTAVVDETGHQVAKIRVSHSAEGLRQLTAFLLEVATRSNGGARRRGPKRTRSMRIYWPRRDAVISPICADWHLIARWCTS